MLVFSMGDPKNPFFAIDLFIDPPIPFEELDRTAIWKRGRRSPDTLVLARRSDSDEAGERASRRSGRHPGSGGFARWNLKQIGPRAMRGTGSTSAAESRGRRRRSSGFSGSKTCSLCFGRMDICRARLRESSDPSLYRVLVRVRTTVGAEVEPRPRRYSAHPAVLRYLTRIMHGPIRLAPRGVAGHRCTLTRRRSNS